MRVGDLVKWNKLGNGYGHLGLVVEVYSNGDYRVYWIIDNDYEYYDERSSNVRPLSSWG